MSNRDESSPLIQMQFDPTVVTEIVFGLYEERLKQLKIGSLAELEASVEDDQMDEIRESLLKAVSGFFPLARIVSTKMKEVLAGSYGEVVETEKT